jgi:outer membrane protein assembly factor BamB
MDRARRTCPGERIAMDSFHLTNFENRWACRASGWGFYVGQGWVAWLFLVANCVAQRPQIPAANPPDVASESPFGVYLPTDRTLSRGVAQARERIDGREYNEAIGFLQGVLDRNEDEFIEDSPGSSASRGLKTTARELISTLPAQGREAYQLLHAADARRGLEAALAADDAEQLARVVRQYSQTPAGFEAGLALAQREFDLGHPLAAAHLYEKLADDRQSEQYQPQLSILEATSSVAAGQLDHAAATLRALVKRTPDATIDVAERTVHLPTAASSDEDLVAWLAETIGTPHAAAIADADWLSQRGDPSRNGNNRGGAPHLSARWQARVVNDPRLENYLAGRREQFQQRGLAAIPAARPIAVGDVILMRTPHNVVAVDFQTGKRIWETRTDESDAHDQVQAGAAGGDDTDEPNPTTLPLEQRVWDDTLTTSLSSDGERVFVLSNDTPPAPQEVNGFGIGAAMGITFDSTASPTNNLTAYDLASEGKLAWQIDGENAGGDLSGAFFLGPPLAINDSLYVLAEIRSAVYLLALDPATGALQWRQQLAGLEQGISIDPARRITGVAPSHADGMLVCPTASGVVVAVDVVHRAFAWAYRYPRRPEVVANVQQPWQGRPDGGPLRENNHWLDSSVIIAEGRVFISPPESTELYCLDLQSGKLIWKHQRDRALFVACVDRGVVLLVGNSTVTALRAADNTPAWSAERAGGQGASGDHIDLPANVQPAGLGYLSQGQYFLPLTNSHVVAIDLEKGTMSGSTAVHNDAELGNLICHRGAIISQSALLVDRFEQIDVLRQRAEAALAQNPRDAAAIRDLAEMRRLDGALPEAIAMLKQAYEIDPSDPVTRDMLADNMLEALAANYSAYQADLPLLREIAQTPQQKIDLLRIDALGLQVLGQHLAAFAAYLRLADAVGLDPIMLRINDDQSVRSDSWVRGRLRALWGDSTPNDQAVLRRELDARRQAWGTRPSTSQLRRYLSLFGDLPGMDEVLVQYARQLLDQRDSLDAEVALLKLRRSPDEATQAVATVLLTKWLMESDRLDEARAIAGPLAGVWKDVPILDGKTGGQWLAEWRLGDLSARTTKDDWPRGQVTASVKSTATPAQRAVTLRSQDEVQLGLRRLRVEQIGCPSLGTPQWFIAQDASRLVGRNGSGQDLFHWLANRDPSSRRFNVSAESVQAAQLGDLMYLTLGSQIIALDSRQSGGDTDAGVLWQAFPAGRFPIALAASGRGGKSIYHESAGRGRPVGPNSSLMCVLGPATPAGVVVAEQRQLRCFDPVNGETLWTRTDIPARCELFGDDEYVLAASMEEGSIYVINMADGQLVDRRDLPGTSWLITAGRNIAQFSETPGSQGRRKTIRVLDVVSGAEKYVGEYKSGVRTTTMEPNSIAVVEPPDRLQMARNATFAAFHLPLAESISSGRIQVIDVRTGKLRVDQTTMDVVQPSKLYALEDDKQVFLFVNGEARQQAYRPIGPDYPIVDGQVYAFDRESGQPAWPGPATIAHRGAVLAAPLDVPLLLFVDHVVKRDAGNSGPQLRLLCVDKRTGATVYRNDDLPATAGQQFRIRATNDKEPSVTIEMSARTVRIEYSTRPRPPEPPANDLVEAPRKTLGRGLWGITRRMGDLIQEEIQNPGGANLGSKQLQRAGTESEDAQQAPADDN